MPAFWDAIVAPWARAERAVKMLAEAVSGKKASEEKTPVAVSWKTALTMKLCRFAEKMLEIKGESRILGRLISRFWWRRSALNSKNL